MANPSYWQAQFDRRANSARAWRVVAEDLVIAADLLAATFDRASLRLQFGAVARRDLRLLQPILLLRAAALEAFLKGRAVRKGHRFVVNGKFRPIPNAGKGHDLLLLADVTLFPLSRMERELCSRLSPCLELARYPVGKSWQTGIRTTFSSGHVMAVYYSLGDRRVMARLLKRLRCAVGKG